jgi:hypothetical protein
LWYAFILIFLPLSPTQLLLLCGFCQSPPLLGVCVLIHNVLIFKAIIKNPQLYNIDNGNNENFIIKKVLYQNIGAMVLLIFIFAFSFSYYVLGMIFCLLIVLLTLMWKNLGRTQVN